MYFDPDQFELYRDPVLSKDLKSMTYYYVYPGFVSKFENRYFFDQESKRVIGVSQYGSDELDDLAGGYVRAPLLPAKIVEEDYKNALNQYLSAQRQEFANLTVEPSINLSEEVTIQRWI